MSVVVASELAVLSSTFTVLAALVAHTVYAQDHAGRHRLRKSATGHGHVDLPGLTR